MKILCGGDCPVYHRMLDSIPSPYASGDSSASIPQLQKPNLLPDITKGPLCPELQSNTAAQELFKDYNLRKPLVQVSAEDSKLHFYKTPAGSQPPGYRAGYQTQLLMRVTWECYKPSSIDIPSLGDSK